MNKIFNFVFSPTGFSGTGLGSYRSEIDHCGIRTRMGMTAAGMGRDR